MENGDLIVNFAPTGLAVNREDHAGVPLMPDEIAESVREACAVGITMVHLHARDVGGRPSHDPAIYAEIISAVRTFAPELVVCVSLSGRRESDIARRLAPLELDGDVKPDMGSFTPGSLNFAREASLNSPEDLVRLAEAMRDRLVLPEIEIFDSGMINAVRYFERKGLLRAPHYANIIHGNLYSAQADLLHAGCLVRDLPPGTLWSMGGIGAAQLPANMFAMAAGGGVRVGLEDNLFWDEARTRRATNRELLGRVVEIAVRLGRTPMAPAELRRRLGLAPGKGRYGLAPEPRVRDAT
ncbi:MAG TPA: 3-keto-5-aminohexanoate cleavage protein [Verrucomicrobiae bacterium]|nr:3-keto-5-aminohexanoate cleavage protein [Verrucomicrobiae bacterium]